MQAIIPLLLLILSTPVWAARPFVTDDARLTTAGSCQVESWSRIYPESTELWVLPACNPTGNLEFTLGSGIARNSGQDSTHDYVFQLKSLFKTLETNGWGIGLAVGTVKHPDITPGPNLLGNSYAYIPYSVSFHDDKLIMHANLGLLKDHQTHQYNTTFGLGAEVLLGPRLIGIVETFGDNRDHYYAQTGLRYSVIPGLFQVDTTVGSRFNGAHDDSWLSFGVRYTPDKIF